MASVITVQVLVWMTALVLALGTFIDDSALMKGAQEQQTAPSSPVGSAPSIIVEVRGKGKAIFTIDGLVKGGSHSLIPGGNELQVPEAKTSVLISGSVNNAHQQSDFIIALTPKANLPSKTRIGLEITEKGSVKVGSLPDAAQVILDKEDTGATTNTLLKDKVGKHTLILKKSGFKDWEKEITVEPDKSLFVFAQLEKQ